MMDVECVVIGAGIAGLAAAATLRRQGRDVIVLEAGPRAGGSAWSERIDGHLVERGPNTFRIPPAMAAFAGEHGLASRLQKAQPASRERFLLRAGRLVPVPMSLVAFARTPLLTRGGDPTGESVAEFAKRRLGCEACDALIAPFLTGVYAGDENQLGAEAVFPTLVAAERSSGSIIRGQSAPVASVAISIASDATRVPLRGFGYLVPRGEGELLLGCLFSSQLFTGRAPPGREVLTLLAVGKRNPEAIDWSDERLVAALLAEIEPVLGLRDAPRVLSITRWPRAVAQPGRNHPRLVAGARAQLAHFPRLALAGSHLDGVAFGEALASGARAAQQVMEER
ncbi:MAG: protoporphyrinogen oxidase [Proteobacteria bacterium]|nr:protoporphyrinogen oxidase [Pseudomonadota bacterium]